MILRKTWQRTALWLGISWSLLWSIILSDLPLIQKLDLWQHDRLLHFNHLNPPPEIVLVPINETNLKDWGLAQESAMYAKIATHLLDQGASVVVLNLLPNWVQTSDHRNNPIKTLIQRHSDRLVLVLPTSNAAQPNPTEWRNYEYFLPNNLSPRSILGFFEYEPEAKHPMSIRSTARQANLSGQFALTPYLDRPETLHSFAELSLQKFESQRIPQPQRFLSNPPSPIQIHFWDKTATFPILSAQSILGTHPSSTVRHKIVLVGFSDIDNPDAFAMQSPFGELMPAIEVQANLLASLLTKAFYRIIPLWLQYSLILLGGVLISQWLVWGTLNQSIYRRYRYWRYPLLGLGGFAMLGILLCGQGWFLPVFLFIGVWTTTGISVLISLLLGVQKDLINQQQCELDRLQTIEQTAAIAQTQKVLRRIAANIHEGPLQELKLIMDRLEMLQLNGEAVNLDPIIDRLEELGFHLRQQLNQARAITFKITPELKAGLDVGIETKLQHLINSGELTLHVAHNLQPLTEPKFNSLWLEAREDIYRCFVEAIHNVIYHAQPPYGTARVVRINLSQQNNRCQLIVENDGAKIQPSIIEHSIISKIYDQYGIKLMEIIASELPDGSLDCKALDEGGMRVKLAWTLAFDR